MKRFIIFQLRDPKTILVTVFALSFSLLSFVIFNLQASFIYVTIERSVIWFVGAFSSYCAIFCIFNISQSLLRRKIFSLKT